MRHPVTPTLGSAAAPLFAPARSPSRGGLIGPGAALLAWAGLALPAAAQCTPTWTGMAGGTNWGVYDAASTGDEGPNAKRVFIGGSFSTVGGTPANLIGMWDGWRWAPVGAPLGAQYIGLRALRAVDLSGPVPDGVYAGGGMQTAGSLKVNHLARWSAPDWFGVGGGLTNGTLATIPMAIREFDEDGPGGDPAALFVGGQFSHAGGVPARGLARWDGAAWSIVGNGIGAFPIENASAWALEEYDDDGPGPRTPALYVGGDFLTIGAPTAYNIARWDGAAWEPLAGGTNGLVRGVAVFDEDGPGPQIPSLFLTGTFSYVGGGVLEARRLARWNGQAWSTVGGWQVNGGTYDMAVFDDDGPGPNPLSLYISGAFVEAPGTSFASRIVRWDGQQFHALSTGLTGFAFPQGAALAVFDEDGPGPNPGGLYVGGFFFFAGSVESHHVARWGCPLPPRCDANCNKDFHPVTGAHVLTIADFACFQTRYVLTDPYADCNEDGSLTIADFGCFQTRFVAGCP